MERDLTAAEMTKGTIDQEALEKIIKDNSDLILKRKLTKKCFIANDGVKNMEPIWMTEHIRKEIKRRRQYNREKRHAQGEERETS